MLSPVTWPGKFRFPTLKSVNHRRRAPAPPRPRPGRWRSRDPGDRSGSTVNARGAITMRSPVPNSSQFPNTSREIGPPQRFWRVGVVPADDWTEQPHYPMRPNRRVPRPTLPPYPTPPIGARPSEPEQSSRCGPALLNFVSGMCRPIS